MSCVEKRHLSHRMGSMLHHRFPNGFTDLFMDETDREVSTLTDRAFRSLCVGDDAVYNDEFLYGFSPFSCHKPLAGEPLKKTHHKESKKQGQSKNGKSAQPWKQQQKNSISQMSSFLKALSATEETCEGMLNKNGGTTDCKGESWDKSALRSIQRELSEFSSDYHTNLKDAALPPGKCSKVKNGKLRKLNIKNFFLHSEFSPFQSWRDFKRFPFAQKDTVATVPTDDIPKWYDMPFYKELTEAHIKETLHIEEVQSCQKVTVEPPPPTAPKPIPPSPPPKVLPKVLPKPSATPAEKRCSSEGGDGSAAPWRRNRSGAKSVIPLNQLGIIPQENSSKTVDESLYLAKKEVRSVEVKAIEEVSSLASTPFSICQLMTPLIPSRQPTETSEILLSPSAFDLPLRPHSEAKLTPEPPVKRENYKSLASSILFNLKDNRKRVKSRYSPPKFKTLEVPGSGLQSPQSDYLKHPQAGSEGNASGLSTPAILKEGQTVFSPVLEPNSTPTAGLNKNDTDRPLSDDYLLSNLLQTKRDATGNSSLGEEDPISPLIHSKKIKSPKAKKQNYPSLYLYKKASSPVDSDMKYLQVPLGTAEPVDTDKANEPNELSPLTLNIGLSPKASPRNTKLSPNTLNVDKDCSPKISPHALDKEGMSSDAPSGKTPADAPDKARQPAKDIREKYFGVQPVSLKEKDTSGQTKSTMDVIRAAKEAINAAKSKALSATSSDSYNKPMFDVEGLKVKENAYLKETLNSKREGLEAQNNNESYQSRNEASSSTTFGKQGNVKKEPPPVPKRTFAKTDIQLQLDKLTNGESTDANLDLPSNDNESLHKKGKLKHLFSARQNNYIKCQRYSVTDDEQAEELKEGEQKVNTGMEKEDEVTLLREARDKEHIMNDLHALKELERARLGDRVIDNGKSKFGVVNIDEETRAKNDLISRELRNIKKGMLSMRGNTPSKRELVANKEKEQNKQGAFVKVDSNVILNKALFNDNYDKAKMALEEIISDRQKRKNTFTDQDANPVFAEHVGDESFVTRVQQCKKSLKDSVTEDKKKQNSSISTLKDNNLKERLGDLRDHNHMRQILSQTEPGLGETRISGGRIALPPIDKSGNEQKMKAKHVNDKVTDLPSKSEDMNICVNIPQMVRQISEDSGESLMNQDYGNKADAPPVPPRSKRGVNRIDDTKETDIWNDLVEEGIFAKDGKQENGQADLTEIRSTGSEKQGTDQPTELTFSNQIEPSTDKERQYVVNNAHSNVVTVTTESILPSKWPQTKTALCLSPDFKGNEQKATFESSNEMTQETNKVKRKAPLKPDHLNRVDGNETSNNLVAEQPDRMNRTGEEIHVDAEAVSEIPRTIISPLLLVNGISVNQSPPDQASLSSKSSYFSVESALHRNTESESNVYHSLENLIGEVEEVDKAMQNISQNAKQDSDKTELEYYSLSDHESEPEVVKRPVQPPPRKTEVPHKDSKEREDALTHQDGSQGENIQTPISPPNTFSPPLVIPALFKVKDNSFINKMKKTIQPWSPRGSLSGSERGEEELHHVKEFLELPAAREPATSGSVAKPDEIFKSKESSSNSSPPLLQSPLHLQSDNQNKPQFGEFLTVPQEEDRYSGISPSSEGVESFTTSNADTADELGMTNGVPVEVSKVPSERSGSTCSGSESQTGLPKPPAVLPKSEKAVLKAIKLANRRMKKEEAQKFSNKSSQSSSKPRDDRHKSERSEHKRSSSSRNNKSSEKRNDKEKMENRHSESCGKNNDDQNEHLLRERRDHKIENHHHQTADLGMTRRQSHDSIESHNQSNEASPGVATGRQGRSSNRHIRDKPEQRHYSSDRVISNVPVYKACISDKPPKDRPFHRSQSIDRHLGDKVERRFSADMTTNEKLDPRAQRIEKSIMDELQQRGRARDKASRDNPLRRSHSIDAHSTEVPRPSTLSRQSSHTSHSSQLSRQSSIEHTIVTQSFPMTQRKLLQDPDSGQYFFVDMPVQVKTKTFFDPETGSYVQLPVQPPEGSVPQASPLEVLTPPMVVYHGFVPVPLSPMAQKANFQAPHMTPEEFEQMHLERSRQIHPYLEPVYAQHDHMLGEFLGTEELDCPS